MNKINVVFMGTPDFCIPVLEGLIENYNVIGVVTQPDKEVGRHHELKATPVKEVALKHNIAVYQPARIRKEYEFLKELNPDIVVTCAYGQIVPKEVLEIPRLGCINVHGSILPKHRGGAPMQRAIMNGDKETGITIMYMDEKMDSGNIISIEKIDILDTDNLESIHDKLSVLGRDLLLKTLPSIIEGTNESIKQNDEEATYSPIISREDEKLDFNKSAREVFNHIRGLSPFPGSYTVLDDKIVKVYNSYIKEVKGTNIGEVTHIYKDGIGVSCNDFEIVLTDVKFEGKKRTLMKDYFNGNDGNKLLGKKFN